MNIISNTCLGAYLMRDCFKEKFSNPFTWNIIDFKSFKNIIKYYSKLTNKNNILSAIEKEGHNFPTLKIENLNIEIQYVHYKDAKCKEELTNNNINNIFLENCEEYALKKFNERIKRINRNPIFIIQIQPNHKVSGNIEAFLKEFSNLKTKYKVIILHPTSIDIPNKSFISIPVDSEIINSPKLTASKYFDLIKRFC